MRCPCSACSAHLKPCPSRGCKHPQPLFCFWINAAPAHSTAIAPHGTCSCQGRVWVVSWRCLTLRRGLLQPGLQHPPLHLLQRRADHTPGRQHVAGRLRSAEGGRLRPGKAAPVEGHRASLRSHHQRWPSSRRLARCADTRCIKPPHCQGHAYMRGKAVPCGRGSYKDTAGNVDCTQCPEGFTTAATVVASENCTDCNCERAAGRGSQPVVGGVGGQAYSADGSRIRRAPAMPPRLPCSPHN